MIVFDGNTQATKKEALLRQQVLTLSVQPKIVAILFVEDAGSRLYSRLKKEAAERVGIEYRLYEFSLIDDTAKIISTIHSLNNNKEITGIIIQKPTQLVWGLSLGMEQGSALKKAYHHWWQALVGSIDEKKDVDGLHPNTLVSIQNGTWQEQGRVLPATCQAVIEILAVSCQAEVSHVSTSTVTDYIRVLQSLAGKKIIILGKSDLLGKPLYYYLHNLQLEVEMMGKKELDERVKNGMALRDADVVITATGRYHLITGEMVKEGAVIIDVGEPQADVVFESVKEKAAFITPVPGGVGPMTVVCLLQNAIKLISK